MSRQSQFKARCQKIGKDVAISPFSAWPSGTYVDTWANEPDPQSGTYPATRPTPTYGTAVTVKAVVQPAPKDEYFRKPGGEEVAVNLVAFVPGDQSVGELDKFVIDSSEYWVAGFAEWKIGTETVYWRVQLVDAIPRET